MEETNFVFESVKFMLLGMGTVYIFLIIMVFIMNLMSKIINKYFPEPNPSTSPTQKQTASNANEKPKVVAAITAAIMHHKNNS